ncbi:uncharacterized protein isoform X3 [Rhodnius prolixus]|uniref:uncharacterized protein isoform X3 n=1 Tax=Rhodnius prolixus TaxID=13249 RepID=UPI003D18D775
MLKSYLICEIQSVIRSLCESVQCKEICKTRETTNCKTTVLKASSILECDDDIESSYFRILRDFGGSFAVAV